MGVLGALKRKGSSLLRRGLGRAKRVGIAGGALAFKAAKGIAKFGGKKLLLGAGVAGIAGFGLAKLLGRRRGRETPEEKRAERRAMGLRPITRRRGILSKRAMKQIRRIKSYRKQIQKAASALGMSVSSRRAATFSRIPPHMHQIESIPRGRFK